MIAATMPTPSAIPKLRQHPAGNQRADDPDDDVADQSIATAFNNHTGKPAGHGTNDQPNDECLCVRLSPRSVLAANRQAVGALHEIIADSS